MSARAFRLGLVAAFLVTSIAFRAIGEVNGSIIAFLVAAAVMVIG